MFVSTPKTAAALRYLKKLANFSGSSLDVYEASSRYVAEVRGGDLQAFVGNLIYSSKTTKNWRLAKSRTSAWKSPASLKWNSR